jgi:predicted NUDIX family NTP pyrophosphohydrolase
VLLVHPGGPFYKNKDNGAWSIPKGEYQQGEDALIAAKREFKEETGNVIPGDKFIQLEPIKIKSGKIISAWAVETNFDSCFIESNVFEMEWPPGTGKKQQFPEVDKAEWFTMEVAKLKINDGQKPLLQQLEILQGNHTL